MAKKKRILDLSLGEPQRRHVRTMFAKRGSKDNFWTPGPLLRGLLGKPARGRGKGQQATLNISAAGGRASKDVPDIGGGGRSTRATIDISGGGNRAARSKGGVPQIGAAGGKGSKGVPTLGGKPTARGADLGGRASKLIPSLGDTGKRGRGADLGGPNGRGTAADLGALVGDGDAGILGGGGSGGVTDISGAIGAESKRGRGGSSTSWRARIGNGVAAHIGFRQLTPQEEAEFQLFYTRAAQAGHDVQYSQLLSWRAEIALNQMSVGDLWKTAVGDDIQRRYGAKGADLDKPEAEREKRTFIDKKEERKEGGILARLKGIITKWSKKR